MQIIEIKNPLMLLVQESGLEKTKGQILLEKFSGYFESAAEIEAKLSLLSEEDYAEASVIRKSLRNSRIDAEKTRKELKESSLRESQTIDAIGKIIKNLIEPLEQKAENIEKAKEIRAAKEKEDRKNERLNKLSAYNVAAEPSIIADMNNEMFESYLSGVEKDYIAKIQQQKIEQEEKERLAKIEKLRLDRSEKIKHYYQFLDDSNLDIGNISEYEFTILFDDLVSKKSQYDLEQQRIKTENEKLKAEKEAREKEIAEERARKEAELKKIQEKAAREKAAVQEQLKAEKEAREQLEKEAKARLDREAKEKAEEEKAQRLAALAPKKEKLMLWIKGLSIGFPNGLDNDNSAKEIIEKFHEFKHWAISKIENIK